MEDTTNACVKKLPTAVKEGQTIERRAGAEVLPCVAVAVAVAVGEGSTLKATPSGI